MFIVWGPERSLLYNDAYAAILASKHPAAIGQDFLSVWHEIRDELEPIVSRAYRGGPVQMDDIELWMERKGYREETHFAFSYTPIRADASQVLGFFCTCQEITEQVLAKRQLGASEARARADAERVQLALAAGAIIGTWVWDIQADRFTVDEAFAQAFGIDPALGRDGLSLEQVVATVHPDDKDALISAIQAALARGGPYAHQYRVQRPDGHYYWIEANGRVEMDEGGSPVSFPGVLLDIEARRTTEVALREATRRLDAILNNTRMAVFLMDERQHCVFANAAAEALTGYRFDEMRDRPLHDVVHHKKPDGTHYPIEECPIDRAFPERAQTSGEELFVAPDGSLYPVAFTASPLLDDDGRPVGTIIEARNISDEKAAEAERLRMTASLESQSATLETLNRSGQAVAAELDLDRIVQMVTDAGVELTGAAFGAFFYNLVDAAGERYMLYALSGVERAAFERFPMPRATAVFHPTFQGEGVVRADDILLDPRYGKSEPHFGMPEGHLPVRSYLAVPVISRSGEVLGGLFFGHPEPGQFDARHERLMTGIAAQAAIAVDNARLYRSAQAEIAERQRVEDELRELNETLEQRVSNEVAERAKAEEALRQAQKMEAVGQLTGGIAHDFNNLLTVVTGNIDMALRALESTGNADARTRRALGNAQKGAERAAALTQRLLAFSRRQPLAPKPIDADRLVAGMSDLVQRALGELVKLEIVTSPGLWRIEADPNQLESAILNLAVNARDAMPEGGTLTIETANTRLDEAYSAEHAEVAPGQYVAITVTDTGAGMSRETQARVFEPFFTTKEVGKGTGLGLSMVYGFVKQSGGHVKIYSEEGHGTSVKIYLPRLMAERQTEVESGRCDVEVSHAQETILVVEDDDDVRAYTVECLRELGYRVLEAHDGPSALRLLERQHDPVQLLFTDVVMPGMTGRELAEKAKELQGDLKVLYTSGYTRNAIVHGGRLDAGVEMIGKPFTFATLAEKVADMLDSGRAGRLLLVSGETTLRMFTAEALAGMGYAVDEAANRAEALARIRASRGRYDGVLLDLGDPTEALAFELRALHADLPILLASDEAEQLASRLVQDPCAGVIARPYSASKLAASLERLGLKCRNSGDAST
ncbi:PAS domain S-box protein [Sphingomonas plantiphila]